MFFECSANIAQLLKAAEGTVSVAESSTGGLISANLLSVPGASSYYRGGSVVYTLEARRAFLTLDKDKLKGLKPLTEETVQVFAHAARASLNTTWGIAELGATGPAGTPYGHRPGVSVIGISGPVNATLTVNTGSDNRTENMLAFTEAALKLFQKILSS
ncbi:MAG: nicotinamide-nucleotide amidase [Candidatus Azotimanducaceae bacterium]|jgi:nicotinamide-nucleotide amidase